MSLFELFNKADGYLQGLPVSCLSIETISVNFSFQTSDIPVAHRSGFTLLLELKVLSCVSSWVYVKTGTWPSRRQRIMLFLDSKKPMDGRSTSQIRDCTGKLAKLSVQCMEQRGKRKLATNLLNHFNEQSIHRLSFRFIAQRLFKISQKS